jgi:hypothetical protein
MEGEQHRAGEGWAARLLPPTTTRVADNTPAAINRRIAERIEESIRQHAAHPEQIDTRLAELDREWDIERTLEANAATITLAGIAAGLFDRRFLLLPALVAGFLLQHALQGWCPPIPFLRARCVRTAAEINRERVALKALRGDFGRRGGRPSEARQAGWALDASAR